MKIRCTILSIAFFAISFSLAAQQPRPGASSNSGQSNTGTNSAASTQPAIHPITGEPIVNSEMFVARADSSMFSLMLDGQSYGAPAKSFTLTNLVPGYHRIQLTKPSVGGSANIRAMAPEVLFDGYVNVPEASRVTAMNSDRQQLGVTSIVPLIQYILGILGQGGQNGNNNGGGMGQGFPWGWPLGPQAMASTDFELLKATIDGKTFDSDKLSILRMPMMNNHFSTNQVTQLVSLFDFESNKVTAAKVLYAKVIDKGNYYLVNNAFDFPSSSRELTEYITGFAP